MTALAPPIWQLAGVSPQAIALEDHRRRVSFGNLEERTNAFGHGLEALGVQPGDHVALVAGNRVEFVEALLGATRAGMLVTPVKTSWTAAEIEYVLRDAGSRAVVTDVDAARAAAAAASTACAASVDGDPSGCPVCGGGEGFCDTSGAPTAWVWLASLNSGNFAGHNDWRLPTLPELEGIRDLATSTSPLIDAAFHGASCGVACTDVTSAACACTVSSIYWSATSYVDPLDAWHVAFGGGYVTLSTKHSSLRYVRAVRGGS